LEDVSKTIRQLERLARPRSPSSPKTPRRNRAIKLYSLVQKHAISLHGTLSEKFGVHSTCHCAALHNANLRLDSIETIAANTSEMAEGEPRFSILFSFDKRLDQSSAPPPWMWREIEFLPINVQLSSPADSSSQLGSETQEMTDRRKSTSSLPAGKHVGSREKASGNRRRDVFLLPARRFGRTIYSVFQGHDKIGVGETAIEEYRSEPAVCNAPH
jgi:hypothetical protein